MKTSYGSRLVNSAVMLISLSLAAALPASGAEGRKTPYKVSGVFVDSCSCKAPCPCEIVGLAHGCEGVGALALDTGSYAGGDLAGVKIAYATVPGKWVRLYIEAAKPEQMTAAEAFGRAAFAAFGKIESVRPAKVTISGEKGNYSLTVDNGKVLSMKMEPVMGGDKKTPVAISNTQNQFAPTFLQGKTVSTQFHDGGEEFTLEGSNAYFQDRMKANGEF